MLFDLKNPLKQGDKVKAIAHTGKGRLSTLPDIPPVQVEGLTLDQAKEKLQDEYRRQIQDVELFITYHDRLKSV
jgi:hypothetical protein